VSGGGGAPIYTYTGEPNLRDYWQIVRRRRMIIVASTVLVALFSFWFAKQKVPVYQATSAVKFEQSTALISLEWCAVQWLVVGLPEELFFRGFLLERLERRFPPRRRILGGGVGLALVLSAAAFALIHLPREGDPEPGLVASSFPQPASRSMAKSNTAPVRISHHPTL